jgi:hypothetical protein
MSLSRPRRGASSNGACRGRHSPRHAWCLSVAELGGAILAEHVRTMPSLEGLERLGELLERYRGMSVVDSAASHSLTESIRAAYSAPGRRWSSTVRSPP